MAKYSDELLDHDYDGIKEMDNSLPRWWLYMFYITIVWAVGYMFYYHVFNVGYLQEDEYLSEINPNYVRVSEADLKILGVLPEYHSIYKKMGVDITPRMLALAEGSQQMVIFSADTDTTTYIAITDAVRIAAGATTFKNICSQCHGLQGEGGVGPNLTDDYWLHGATISNVVKSVKYGYPAKGMIPWLGTLKEDEIIDVSSYVMTLRGTNPSNARAPQGDLVTE